MSPNDEFGDFEIFANMINVGMPSQIRYGFYREALGTGMRLESQLGYNPFKMGLVGGADVHSGYQGNEEFNYYGGHGNVDDTPKKRLNPNVTPAGVRGPIPSSAATTAVWAEENTRESIFDGMKRKGDLRHFGNSDPSALLRQLGLPRRPDLRRRFRRESL